MAVRFEYRGKKYKNAVEMSKDLPLLTSVLIGWYDGAEVIQANAGAICYDTDVSYDPDKLEPCRRGKGIIKHCRDSEHSTVVEHGMATFLKKVPIFVARQDMRARIATFDERSLRYCRANDGSLTYYIPDFLSQENIDRIYEREGASETWLKLNKFRSEWINQHERAIDFYSKYTDEELNEFFDALGVDAERVRETVRASLPIGINTIYVDSRDVWSWYHHSLKRLCLRAQKEIRIIRQQEVSQLRKIFPTTFGDVNMPCYMECGCPEKKKCGLVPLDSSGKYALGYLKLKEKRG